MNEIIITQLKDSPNWVAYEIKWDGERGRKKKLPLNPHDGSPAKANDPATWGSYNEAMSLAIENAGKRGTPLGMYDGVGFEFNGSGIAGIDLDHCINDKGELSAIAREIVDLMDSYTEYSPSEKGLHILFKLDRPLSQIGKGNRNDGVGLEMYDTGRFFTVTGKPFEALKPIAERTEQARQVHKKYIAKPEQTKMEHLPLLTVDSRDLTDQEILEKMFNSKNGRDIEALFSGDISAYGEDHSRADMALCSYLAYWTNKDEYQIDSLFRQSRLMRPKWDEKHYSTGETYGQRTISEALNLVPEFTPQTKNDKDKIELNILSHEGDRAEVTKSEILFVDRYLEERLENDLKEFDKFSNRKTGFSNFDTAQSLYPGLYVLGGVSSVGKTAFAVQLADQLAKLGEHVLYFPLEATPLEIISRGLSRLTAQEDFTLGVSSIDIRSGRITDSVRRAIFNYKSFSAHEAIVPCNFRTTSNEIISVIKSYIQATGISPCVFVDYLQLLRPSDKKMTTKESVEANVQAFKLLQLECNTVIFLISSLNRQNYLTTIDFEAFKETGGIEYTADVMLGLQLHAMNNKIFDEDKKLSSKREVVRQAKKANPRKIELVVLKNRFGVTGRSFYFDYYPNFDLYTPVDIQEWGEEEDEKPAKRGRL